MRFLRWFLFLVLILLFFKFVISYRLPNILGINTTKTYSIAIIGDSMVETMGEGLEYLDSALKEKYPNVTFKLYNYGVGSQNIEEGLGRFSLPFKRSNRDYPSLTHLSPDILIVASFAYNPPFPYDTDKYKVNLSKMVQEAINTQAEVYVLAEIAPLENNFGKGPGGPNWPEDLATAQSSQIVRGLKNALSIAQDLPKVKLIDAYTPTATLGEFGSGKYTDPHDNIHPSIEGQKFVADLIVSKIKTFSWRARYF